MEAKMLDIISMIIILFFLMGLPMILIIIGGSKSKSEQERAYELEEEAQYWRNRILPKCTGKFIFIMMNYAKNLWKRQALW